MIRTPLETGPQILLAQWEVLAPFYITQNTTRCFTLLYTRLKGFASSILTNVTYTGRMISGKPEAVR